MGMLTDNERETIDALLKAGFDADDISSLMGNIAVETGNSFDHTQKQKGGGGGYGLFQFTGSHKDDYFDWVKENGFKDSKFTQAKFVHDNIYSDFPFSLNPLSLSQLYELNPMLQGDKKVRGYGRDLGWRDRGLLQIPTPMALSPKARERVPVSQKTKTFANVYEKAGKPHMRRRLKEAHDWEEELYGR